MIEVLDTKEQYISTFSRFENSLTGNNLSWLRRIRQTAIDRFAKLGFPTGQDEEWKFTPVDSLVGTPFTPAERPSYDRIDLDGYTFDAHQGVFLNGYFIPELSSLNPAHLDNLATLLSRDAARLEPYLGRHAGNAFMALNTAFLNDGAFVHLPQGCVLERPIHLLFATLPGQHPLVSHPRVFIVAEDHTKATIVESYISLGSESAFTNAVTEIIVGENASIEHGKIQRENEASFHIGTIEVHQDRSSAFTSHSIALGGALTRNDIRVQLAAEGAECTLNGLYRVGGRQHVDHHTTIDHLKPHGSSRELYKGILDGNARAVFNGKIVVRPNAQKTDALQTNKNLLLSGNALVHTKPQLEIFANDVKCKHGATIGQIAPDMLFYLRSRGIDLEVARRLLVHAFAAEMIERIGVEPIRASLNKIGS